MSDMAIATLAEIDEALVGNIGELLISRSLAEHIMSTFDLSNRVLAEKENFDTSQYRIEALRAASQVIERGFEDFRDKDTGERLGYADATIRVAEQFAKWLETGER